MRSTHIRWLHLSDIHMGKDIYGQQEMFRHILAYMQKKVSAGEIPDFVFITGDLANRGQAAEYAALFESLLSPLIESFGKDWDEKIFSIPGNHDVDRNQARTIQSYDLLSHFPFFLRPTQEGLAIRKEIFPRFEAYVTSEYSSAPGEWLFSEKGAFTYTTAAGKYTIGILGINTAWFSQSDEDLRHMTPGKEILEMGLRELSECDIRIVLGHHPIDWFLEDHAKLVRVLFSQNNVIYLHGHLHDTEARHIYASGNGFLELQAGAAFQAYEDNVWVNRFLWCELDLGAKKLRVEPVKWSKKQQRLIIDNEAFAPEYQETNTAYWSLPLPRPQTDLPLSRAETEAQPRMPKVPPGWRPLDRSFLDTFGEELTHDQAINYFNGHTPGWKEAVSERIPQREMVQKLQAQLMQAQQATGILVTVLMGPGGEGKSTILRQLAHNLVKSGDGWNVLWHDDPATPLPHSYAERLPSKIGTWLIISDDGDLIAEDVFATVQRLRARKRSDIHFLLCCRTTDWRRVENSKHLDWSPYVKLVPLELRGMSAADAALIVDAWKYYGEEGLGRLAELDMQDAAKQLVMEAASQARQSTTEGSLLGALLQVRFGEDLKDRVRTLLHRLEGRPAPGGNLLNAFAYIAAPHAQNVLSLSKEILADIFQCTPGEIIKDIVLPLGGEAAIDMPGQYMLVRHRAIAEAALHILLHEFGMNLDEIYVDLVRSAEQLRRSGTYIPQLKEWRYLSEHFVQNGAPTLGFKLAHMLCDIAPTDAYFVSKLGKLYRQASEPAQSVQIFRNVSHLVLIDREFYHEWATSEGVFGNLFISIWLIAISIADDPEQRRLDNDRIKIGLNGLAIAFHQLSERLRDPSLLELSRMAAQLGLIPRGSSETLRTEDSLRNYYHPSIPTIHASTAYERLQSAIIWAWEEREQDLADWVTPADQLRFSQLAARLQL